MSCHGSLLTWLAYLSLTTPHPWGLRLLPVLQEMDGWQVAVQLQCNGGRRSVKGAGPGGGGDHCRGVVNAGEASVMRNQPSRPAFGGVQLLQSLQWPSRLGDVRSHWLARAHGTLHVTGS